MITGFDPRLDMGLGLGLGLGLGSGRLWRLGRASGLDKSRPSKI